MNGLVLLWAALLAPPVVVGYGGGIPGPISVSEPRDGPRVLYREMAEPPLVALRLSVPVEEPPGLTGAARVLQELARESLEARAADLGARAALERTAGHAVYTLVGPRESFDAMVELLRRSVGRPPLARHSIEAARLRVEREALAMLELPAGRVRLALGALLFPGFSPSANAALPDRLGPDALEWFWRRYYVPERMTVAVAGADLDESAFAAFRDWPAPPAPSGAAPASASGDREAPAAEATRSWTGIGWSADDADPAALAVAAVLVNRRLASEAPVPAEAELWWGRGRLGLVAIAAVSPGSSGPDGGLAEWLRLEVERTAERLTPSLVTEARRSLAWRLLLDARTPEGLARLIGGFHDHADNPRAATDFLDALGRVDAARVRAALRPLLARSPAVAEVVP